MATAAIAAAGLGATASADSTPVYPGGEEALNQYLTETVKYPETAKENGIEGVVMVSFTVEADGSIKNPKIVRPIDPDLEAEALRVVKGMPKWTPADVGGTPVAASVQLPVKFRL